MREPTRYNPVAWEYPNNGFMLGVKDVEWINSSDYEKLRKFTQLRSEMDDNCIKILEEQALKFYGDYVYFKLKNDAYEYCAQLDSNEACMVESSKQNILNYVLSKLCQITPDPAGKVDFEEVLAQFKGSLDVVTVTEEQPQDIVYLTKEQRLDQHIKSVGLTIDSKGKIVNLNMRESVKD